MATFRTLRHRPFRRAAVLPLVALATLVLLPPVTSGATTLTPVAAPLPSNAFSVPQAILNAVTCTSAGNCVAVGRYETASAGRALVSTETNGVWGASRTITMPSNALGGANGVLNGVSCTSPGNCVAVGQYENTKSTSKPTINVVNSALIVTESGGVWGTAIASPMPSGTRYATITALNGVSCPSAGNCVAVGQYASASGDEGYTVYLKSGKWQGARRTALPHWAKSNFITQLDAVSCVKAGYCVAVGQFVTSAPARQALEVVEVKGTWQTGHAVTLPSSTRDPWAGLFGISCPKWGYCTAVGVYQRTSSGGQGLIVNEYKGQWKTGIEAPLPPGPKSSAVSNQLLGIDCVSFGNCDAVGQYTDKSIEQGTTLTEQKGHWGGATDVPRPSDAISPPYVGLNGVDCSSASACVMVGQYQSSLGQPALIVTK